MSLEIGKIVDGKVSGITKFGAFIDIGEGKTGLVHISEIAGEYVNNINDYVEEGQAVRVKIVSQEAGGKIGLSMRKAAEEEAKAAPKKPAEFNFLRKDDAVTFEDKMLRFKQDSEEKMHYIKRGMESKRGGYRKGSGSY